MLIAIATAIITIIVGQVNSPKLDLDRLNALTKQYMDEMSRTPPTASPGAPGF
ncbi:hypothetical protein FACS1894166_06790 [Bacilli bacterium]|nr:hypothetical protein FACS1894166_06790 [Bacilli bacterium]